jgi:hypothetical protein
MAEKGCSALLDKIRIDVMDIVKAPEKWHSVVGHMPIVEPQMH